MLCKVEEINYLSGPGKGVILMHDLQKHTALALPTLLRRLKAGGYKVPPSQTPWQEIFRKEVGQLDGGMVLKGATKFQRVAKTMGLPRDNH